MENSNLKVTLTCSNTRVITTINFHLYGEDNVKRKGLLKFRDYSKDNIKINVYISDSELKKHEIFIEENIIAIIDGLDSYLNTIGITPIED